MNKNLYLVSRTDDNYGYDVILEFIVCQRSTEAARNTNPHPEDKWVWVEDINKDLEVVYIGTAAEDIKIGQIILISFLNG